MKLAVLILVFFGTVSGAWCQLPWQQVYSGVSLTNYYIIKEAGDGNVYAFSPDQSINPILLRSNSNGNQSTWASVSLPSNWSGKVRELNGFFVNGRDMYIMVHDTLWWSDNYAASWRMRSAVPYGNGSIGFIPFVNNAIFYLGGGGLYSSADQGMTWKQLSTLPAVTIIQRGAETFAFHANHVLKSSDGGAIWVKLNTTMSLLPTFDITLLSNNKFLLLNGKNVYESVDAINWSAVPTTGLPARLDVCEVMVKAPKSDSLFAIMVDVDSMKGELFFSPDAGRSWMDFSQGVSAGPEGSYALFVANGYVFCSDPSGVICRTTAPLALSAGSSITKGMSSCKVYPNPGKDRMIVEGVQESTVVQLLNIMGVPVLDVVSDDDKIELNTKAMAPGSYILQMIHKDGKKEVRQVEIQ
jgi:hypothetical protein